MTEAEDQAAAIAEERAAWDAVKDKLPGTPCYSPELWERWRAAAARADEVRRKMLSDLGKSRP